jgi:hypothetical protein
MRVLLKPRLTRQRLKQLRLLERLAKPTTEQTKASTKLKPLLIERKSCCAKGDN